MHRQVDGCFIKQPIGKSQHLLGRAVPDDGVRAALTRANLNELIELIVVDGQHIALLGFVAPDLLRRHSGIGTGDVAKLEAPSESRLIQQFRDCIGQPSGAHIVDGQDWVIGATGCAMFDDFLAAALHFRIAALHGSIVQILGAFAAGHGGCCPTPETDQHGRTAKDHNRRALREFSFFNMRGPHIAKSAGKHDRFVITAHVRAVACFGHIEFQRSEIPKDVGASELVVKACRTDGPLDHDLKRRDNPVRFSIRLLPRLQGVGQPQVGYRKTAQSCFWTTSPAHCSLVSDLTPGSCGSPRVR